MSEVRASHLLVKHQGSRRPASWRDPDGAVITKRSKAAALDELEAYREQIESGAVTFADLAAKVSDCSSAKHGGDLGFFGPGKMQKAFEVRRNTPQRCSQPAVDSLSTNRLIWSFPRPKVPFSKSPSVPDHCSPNHLSPQDGAFALQVGEMSGVVDSDSGVHIIIRTA
jgi:NIMA-interacting peptidyl-prolyl cis-trans isomerase 1